MEEIEFDAEFVREMLRLTGISWDAWAPSISSYPPSDPVPDCPKLPPLLLSYWLPAFPI